MEEGVKKREMESNRAFRQVTAGLISSFTQPQRPWRHVGVVPKLNGICVRREMPSRGRFERKFHGEI